MRAHPDVIEVLQQEVERSRAKYPTSAHTFAAIVESTGTLAKALLCDEHPNIVRAKAFKVAALAVRLIEEGDPLFRGHERIPNECPGPGWEWDAVALRWWQPGAKGPAIGHTR